MALFQSRRRRGNRRRRHGWLTPRGRASLGISCLALTLGAFAGLVVWRAGEPSEAASPVSSLNRAAIAVESAASIAPDEMELRVGTREEGSAGMPEAGPPLAPGSTPSQVEAPVVSTGPPTSENASFESARPFFDPPRTRDRFEQARNLIGMNDPRASARLSEWRDPAVGGVGVATPGRVRVEYTLDEELTEEIFEILRRGRVSQGHAIVMDPRTGRLLAYVSTDEEGLPAAEAYPAASIVKILTASAVLETDGPNGVPTCIYRGNKYRLNHRRLDPPRSGQEANLETALASSNNQCFARWALHSVGEDRLRSTFARFGWLDSPAPGHRPGELEPLETPLDLGRLGSGLDGLRVTPLHVAQVASILTSGEWIEPWWIERVVDAFGRPLRLPDRRPNRTVLSRDVADSLRSMLVSTTKRGTAKSAFRDRRGRPRVGSIDIAGKTGNLTGWDPYGRYEWFFGLAPAEEPKIAVVVLQLQGHMWWRRSTELASDVLREVFCNREGCHANNADRLTGDPEAWTTPQLLSWLGRPELVDEPGSE